METPYKSEIKPTYTNWVPSDGRGLVSTPCNVLKRWHSYETPRGFHLRGPHLARVSAQMRSREVPVATAAAEGCAAVPSPNASEAQRPGKGRCHGLMQYFLDIFPFELPVLQYYKYLVGNQDIILVTCTDT